MRNRNGRFQKKRSVVEIAWAKNGTPDTLSGTADTIQITDLTANVFNQFMEHDIDSGNTYGLARFNADTGTNYSNRNSEDGGAEVTNTNDTEAFYAYMTGLTRERFNVAYVCSISGEEKLGIVFTVEDNSAGATNAPKRNEIVFKYVPSPDADITQISITNGGSGDFAAGSNLSALGTN